MLLLGTIPLTQALSVAFSPNGSLVAAGHTDGSVSVWQVRDATRVRTLVGYQDAINAVAFSPDGTLLAAGGGTASSGRDAKDTSVRLWRIADGQLLQTFTGHRDRVSHVAFHPNGQMIVSVSDDWSARFWSLP
jgi:WD40 repeat protein